MTPSDARRRTATTILIATVLAAAGCPISPQFVKPEVPLNTRWSAGAHLAKAAINVAWWRAFNDPVLNRLVDIAYKQNLPLQIAGLRILEARAQLGFAIGQQYPSNPGAVGSAALNGLHEHSSSAQDLDLVAGRYQVGFDALYEIDLWGKYRRGVKAAKATYLATVADYDASIVALTAEVARTYAIIRTNQVLLAYAKENVAVQEEGQRIAESRFRNGATSELDLAQATNLLESTRATIPELQVGLQQAANALCTLIGRSPGCAAPLLAGPNTIPAVPAQVAVGVPADMMRRRPDIRSAELTALAQCDRIGVAKSDLFPKLTLLGSVGTLTVQSSGAPPSVGSLLSLFNPGALLYSIGASLFWPILSYPKILNNVRVQDARFQEALVNYVDTVLRAAQEVEDGIAGFEHEQEAERFAQNAVTAAQLGVKLALVQYREGASNYTRVLDTQRALLSSQNGFAKTQSQVVVDLIALYKALGGGWEIRTSQPVVTDETREEMQKRTNWGSYFKKTPPPAPPTKR